MLTDHIQTRVAVVLSIKCAGCGSEMSQHDMPIRVFARLIVEQYGWTECGTKPQPFCPVCAIEGIEGTPTEEAKDGTAATDNTNQ